MVWVSHAMNTRHRAEGCWELNRLHRDYHCNGRTAEIPSARVRGLLRGEIDADRSSRVSGDAVDDAFSQL